MEKDADAFRTISEVAEELDLPQHVLRFWETRFTQIRPLKRGGGRRYYRPDDVDLLRAIRHLLYGEGYTIKGVQRLLKDLGARTVAQTPLQGHTPRPAFTRARRSGRNRFRSRAGGCAADGARAGSGRDAGASRTGHSSRPGGACRHAPQLVEETTSTFCNRCSPSSTNANAYWRRRAPPDRRNRRMAGSTAVARAAGLLYKSSLRSVAQPG